MTIWRAGSNTNARSNTNCNAHNATGIANAEPDTYADTETGNTGLRGGIRYRWTVSSCILGA